MSYEDTTAFVSPFVTASAPTACWAVVVAGEARGDREVGGKSRFRACEYMYVCVCVCVCVCLCMCVCVCVCIYIYI